MTDATALDLDDATWKNGVMPKLSKTLAIFAVAAAALVGTTAANSHDASAVVNGEDVSGNGYEWAVAFVRPNDGTPVAKRTYCSGVLLKPSWVLTAAHCPIVENSDTVVIGRGALSSTAGEKRKAVDVIRMWDDDRGYCVSRRYVLCDIALVELSSPSTMDDLDLAGASVLAEWGEGSAARAYGYGQVAPSSGESSGHLRRAHLTITDFRSNHYTLFARGGSDAVCYRDSGGPLVVSTSEGPKVVGVVRAAVDHDPSPCTPDFDQSYTKVGWRGSSSNSQPYRWIVDTI